MPMAAGDVVIRQGDPSDRFYVIGSGTVVVTRPTRPVLPASCAMGPDEVFGELGLLSGAPRSATVTAATDGLLLALDADAFLDLVDDARRSAGGCSTSSTRCRPRHPPDVSTQPGTTLGSPRSEVYRPPT